MSKQNKDKENNTQEITQERYEGLLKTEKAYKNVVKDLVSDILSKSDIISQESLNKLSIGELNKYNQKLSASSLGSSSDKTIKDHGLDITKSDEEKGDQEISIVNKKRSSDSEANEAKIKQFREQRNLQR